MDVPPADATVVARLRAKGAIIYAKSVAHEFNAGPGDPGGPASARTNMVDGGQAISAWSGQACNPYDTERVPRGSSSGSGVAISANLATIGTQQTRQQLAESILYPNKAVRDGYQQEIVVTVDDDLVSGAVKVDTAVELILQDAAGNKHRFRKPEIKERRASTISLMPEGLYAGLSQQQFADLVSFLESLKGNPEQRR
jgi:putative heme-binding domain-containing protein